MKKEVKKEVSGRGERVAPDKKKGRKKKKKFDVLFDCSGFNSLT